MNHADPGCDHADPGCDQALELSITREALRSGSPLVWHAGRRHAPSPSSACRNTNRRQKPQGRLVVDPVTVRTPLMDIKVRPGEVRPAAPR